MHTIEPYYRWRKHYIASEDEKSPFYGRSYSEFEFTNKIYNYLIHPQWDEFGSETLYLKILYINYDIGVAIIEFIGEWNDTLYNDIMYLKREVIDVLLEGNIKKFILIGENVLNFHASDDSYYEEWFSEIQGGWIVAVNFQEHVISELMNENIGYYVILNTEFSMVNWRSLTPLAFYNFINNSLKKKISIE